MWLEFGSSLTNANKFDFIPDIRQYTESYFNLSSAGPQLSCNQPKQVKTDKDILH